MRGENNKSKIISLCVALIIFAALFISFWFIFFQNYFNNENRGFMLGILIACIVGAFLLALTVSNAHKVFSWHEFAASKSPIELRLIACECWAQAGMMEKEGMKMIEDRMLTINDNHNLELIRLKAEIKNNSK